MATFRHSSRAPPTSRLQRRHPLLPGLGAGPIGGSDRARGDLEALPRMGGRPQLRRPCLRRPPCVDGRLCRRFSVESNTSEEMRVTMTGRVEGKVAFINRRGPWPGPRACGAVGPGGAPTSLRLDICKQIETVSIPLSTPEDLAEDRRPRQWATTRRIYTAEVDVRDYAALKAAVDTAWTSSVGWTSSSPMPASATVGRRWTKTSEKRLDRHDLT